MFIMQRQDVTNGKLYTGTSREILSLYKNLKERNIYNRTHEGYLKMNTLEKYGLFVRNYNTEKIMYIISECVLGTIYG